MATAQRPNSGNAPRPQATRTDDAAALLSQMIESFTPSERTKYIYDTLAAKIETIRDLLCEQLKPHAERFVKRAMMTFQESEQLRKCTDASFIKCVLKAAECGLAIDGKLGYAVPRNNSKKDKNGNWTKQWEASFQPSYVGLIAVAKRTGTILTAYGDVICEHDVWEYERRFGADHFVHRRAPLGSDRGRVIGAYQKLVLPNNLTHIEVMDIQELNAIMEMSESYKYAEKGKQDSVWHKHRTEMQKKTVVHRALKTYQDDPGLMVAMNAVESDFEFGEPAPPQHSGRVGRSTINDELRPPQQPADNWPQQDDDPFSGPSSSSYDAVDDAPGDDYSQAEPEPKTKAAAKSAPAEAEADAGAMRTLIERIKDAETPMELGQVRDEIGALSLGKMQRAELEAMLGKRSKELGK